MTKKSILSTVLVSFVAVSMVACSGNESKHNDGQATLSAVDSSLEGQLKTHSENLSLQKEELKKLQDQSNQLGLDLIDAEQSFNLANKKYQELALLDEYVAKGNTMPNSEITKLDAFPAVKADKEEKEEILNELKAEADILNMKIHKLTFDIKRSSDEVTKTELEIDVRNLKDSSDYKAGNVKNAESIDYKQNKINEITDRLNEGQMTP